MNSVCQYDQLNPLRRLFLALLAMFLLEPHGEQLALASDLLGAMKLQLLQIVGRFLALLEQQPGREQPH